MHSHTCRSSLYCPITILPSSFPQADDVKTLLRDLLSPAISDADAQRRILGKASVANTGLTAASASLLCNEYDKDMRAEIGDGSERPLSDHSGVCVYSEECLS